MTGSMKSKAPRRGKRGTSRPRKKDVYELTIVGGLDPHWELWFEGARLEQALSAETGEKLTVITAAIEDQPELYGLLEKIRDLNLTLVSVRRIGKSGHPAPRERDGVDEKD